MILYKFLSDDDFKKYWNNYLNGEFFFSDWRDLNDPMEGFFSYVVNRPGQDTIAKDIISEKNQFTVLCMAEESSNFLLWSHYAKKHKGACLEVEVDAHRLSAQNIVLEKIKYPNRVPALSPHMSPQEQAKRMLMRKLFFWRYEKEYRFLSQSPTPGLHIVGTLKKVIFGIRFGFLLNDEHALRSEMVSHLRSSNVAIHQADFDFQTYQINSHPTRRFG